MQAAVRKYTFDTHFDADGTVTRAPGRRLSYTPDEVEAARAEAYAQGENSATARAQAAAAEALGRIGQDLKAVVGTLGGEATRLRHEACALAMHAARAAAREALAQFPEGDVAVFVSETLKDLRDEPRVVVRLAPDVIDAVRPRLETLAAEAGLADALAIEPADVGPGDVALEWAVGGVSRTPDEILARVDDAVARWLAREDEKAAQMDLFGE